MKEKFKNSKYKKPFLYIAFFIAAFFLFLYSSFPKEGIKSLVVSEIESNTPYQAHIESASLSFPLGLNVKELRLKSRANGVLVVDSLDVRPSVFSIFSSSTVLPFKAELGGGTIKGTLSVNKSGSGLDDIEAEVKGVEIDNVVSFMSNSEEAPDLKGALDGTLSIDFSPNALGEFDFTAQGLSVDNIKVKGIKLPALNGLETVFSGNIEGEKTNVEELYLKGDGIDLKVTGTAPLIWELTKGGVIDLGYRLEITGGEYAKFKGMLTPYLAQQTDGSLGGKIIGTLNNPKFEKGSTKRF